jgi:uncharacterized protein (DUF58 family)
MSILARGFGGFFRFLYRNHSLFIVLVAFAIVATLAAISGYWVFYRAAYVLGALVPLCFIWARVHARGLEVSVERTTDRLQVGQEAEARVRLKSESMWTKLWLEVEDETDMPGAWPKTVVTLPSKGNRNWKLNMRCRRRGVYTAGPVRITTGDPFGLFRFSRTYGERTSLMVLPQPEELPYFWAPAAQLPGEGVVRRRTHYVTPNAASIREYHPGDSYNRIHWRSTARLGRLMVKTFEMDPTSNIWIVLDLHGAVQVGAEDESTEEYGVRIAASLAYRFLNANRMLGLMMFGRETVVLDPGRGGQQYNRILESLATADASGSTPLAQVLQEEGRRFGRHTTLIVITPSPDREWVASLHQLLRQGTRTAAVLLDAETFAQASGDTTGSAAASPLPTDELLAGNILSYVVPAKSDLGLMLGPAGIIGDSATERQTAAAH